MKVRAWMTLALSVAGFLVPGTLFVGLDLSSLAQPTGPEIARFGDQLVLDVKGWLDNGTVFQGNASLRAVLGRGDLVPGLEDALVGTTKGSHFNVSLSPEEGYGEWNPKRTAEIQENETINRTFALPRAQFEAQAGPPYAGERLRTQPWPSTVVSIGAQVVIRYEPTANVTVRLYRYWTSRVVAFNATTIRWTNLLRPGDAISIPAGRGAAPTTFRVTSLVHGNLTLDANPPLAGQRLHFEGTVRSIKAGTYVRKASGDAFSLSRQSCEQCHGGSGFVALQTSASAVRVGQDAEVNVTIVDPWLHDLRRISAGAHAINGTRGATDQNVGADLSSQGQETLHVKVPIPNGNATVQVVINATAHHQHLSRGKPDDLPYEVVLNVTVGASAGNHALVPLSVGRTRAWNQWGRVTGFLALGAMVLPVVQGFRRHQGRRAWFRRPAWLTTHFVASWLVLVLSLVHAEALMSSTWRNQWSWGVVAGVVALVILGLMGLSGMVLAAWVKTRLPTLRKWHYRMMLAAVGLAAWHTVVIGTTAQAAMGWVGHHLAAAAGR